MKKYILAGVCFTATIFLIACPATAGSGSIKHITKGRVIKPQKQFKGSLVVSETIRIVTAYNAGDPAQNQGNPCISANGENLCKALASGKRRCAANFVPMGTNLYIETYGYCEVTDRTNKRYRNRVDIAMRLDEHKRAIRFGRKKLNVKILTSNKIQKPQSIDRLAKLAQSIQTHTTEVTTQ